MALVVPGRFRQLPEKTKIWRYMDLVKYLDLISTGTLYFPRIDQFPDPFEGYNTTRFYRERRAPIAASPHVKELLDHIARGGKWESSPASANPIDMEIALHDRRTDDAGVSLYANCWHANEVESAAMWDLYVRSGAGIAIVSDYQSLCDIPGSQIFIGAVNYVDYDQKVLPVEDIIAPAMYKRLSFEHEREVRAILLSDPFEPDPERPSSIRRRNDIPAGIRVPVNLQGLIKYVRILPNAPDFLVDVIKSSTKSFGFDFEVHRSDLYVGPVR